jgi:hypothetical protein
MFNSYERSNVNWQETVFFNELNAVIRTNTTHAFYMFRLFLRSSLECLYKNLIKEDTIKQNIRNPCLQICVSINYKDHQTFKYL